MAQPQLLQSGIVNVSFGERVQIVQPVNLYGCKLADDCFVGPFVEIQNEVVIGPRTRVQSHVFICELVTIGSDCFISHGAMFINDRMSEGKAAFRSRETWGKTVLGDRVVVGTNATILPVSICGDVTIGAGSVVTSDIVKPGIYAGNPARFRRALPGPSA
jgi:acetyltransferase-like isoleucine patch superfamily enzyme